MTRAPTLHVALGEYDTGWHAPLESLARARALVRDAAGRGARLVVLPEMTATGFTMDAAQASSIDGPHVTTLREIAHEAGCWIVAGVALREPQSRGGERVVNAALAIDPAGAVAAVHRKQRLFAFASEHAVYAGGDRVTSVAIDGVRVGLYVCYELRFPELFGVLAREVDCVVVIANWPAARRPHWDVLLRARAIENQYAVIGVNRTGAADGIVYDGGSAAWDAWGEGLPAVDASGRLVIVSVDARSVAGVRERYPFLRDRFPPR